VLGENRHLAILKGGALIIEGVFQMGVTFFPEVRGWQKPVWIF